jgi:hypothetical protein
MQQNGGNQNSFKKNIEKIKQLKINGQNYPKVNSYEIVYEIAESENDSNTDKTENLPADNDPEEEENDKKNDNQSNGPENIPGNDGDSTQPITVPENESDKKPVEANNNNHLPNDLKNGKNKDDKRHSHPDESPILKMLKKTIFVQMF